MDKIQLSTQLLNAVMQYLSTQPYAQVAGLIKAVQDEVAAQQTQSDIQVQ